MGQWIKLLREVPLYDSTDKVIPVGTQAEVIYNGATIVSLRFEETDYHGAIKHFVPKDWVEPLMRIKLTKPVAIERDEEDSFDDEVLPVGTMATVLYGKDDVDEYWVELDDKTFSETRVCVPKTHAEVIDG